MYLLFSACPSSSLTQEMCHLATSDSHLLFATRKEKVSSLNHVTTPVPPMSSEQWRTAYSPSFGKRLGNRQPRAEYDHVGKEHLPFKLQGWRTEGGNSTKDGCCYKRGSCQLSDFKGQFYCTVVWGRLTTHTNLLVILTLKNVLTSHSLNLFFQCLTSLYRNANEIKQMIFFLYPTDKVKITWTAWWGKALFFLMMTISKWLKKLTILWNKLTIKNSLWPSNFTSGNLSLKGTWNTNI